MQTLILLTLCLGAVYGGVPKSSYTRTEEGQMVAIPGLETTTTTPIDNAIGEVFGETTLAQDKDTSSSPVASSNTADSSSEATPTEKSKTTPKPTTEKPKVTTTSSTTQKPTTEEKADASSPPPYSTTAASVGSSESTSKAPGGGSFGFNVAFPNIPTLPPIDKIKIPNPLGGLFSG